MNGINKDPFACKLACHLVKAQFGDICEVIVGLINPMCDRLLPTAQTIPFLADYMLLLARQRNVGRVRLGTQHRSVCRWTSILQIRLAALNKLPLLLHWSAGFKPSQLHSALLVLIQHNFVNCYLETEEANPRRPHISQTLYEADLPAILQNLRHDTLLPLAASRHNG